MRRPGPHEHSWHRAWQARLLTGGFIAHYVRAATHRRIFLLIGAAMAGSGLLVGLMGHVVGVDVQHRTGGYALAALFVIMLWGISGRIARRLTHPFVELSRVAQEIGRGNLSARYVLRKHGRSGEAFLIGVSINDMAARIEKQLKDQRELLAAVSHEVRTPLARIRMLVELARSRTADGGFLVDAKALDDIDREVMEIDALVGELLASSRLDFAVVATSELDACDVARRALERQTLDARLALPAAPVLFRADPTLLHRALANILHNATVHGGGVDVVSVIATDTTVCFTVADRGPGLPPGEEDKVFESFYRGGRAHDGDATVPASSSAGDTHSALGLGLALVRRIAKAHGGRAFARNRADGPGAEVGIELPRQARAVTT